MQAGIRETALQEWGLGRGDTALCNLLVPSGPLTQAPPFRALPLGDGSCQAMPNFRVQRVMSYPGHGRQLRYMALGGPWSSLSLC